MASVDYFYPATISQVSTGGTSFKNLDNVSNESLSSYSVTTNASAYTNILVFQDFNVSLPLNAQVKEAVLEYAYQKTNFDAKKPYDGVLYTGITYNENDLTVNSTVNLKDTVVTSSLNIDLNKVNRLHFNLFAMSPTHYNNTVSNNSTSGGTYQNKGYVRICFIRVKIVYELPGYSLSVKRADHHNAVNQETVFSVNITNLNKTDHAPTVTIALPSGVVYEGSSNLVSVRDNLLTWKPNLSSNVLSASLAPKFLITSVGEKTFTISESYNTAAPKTVTFEAVSGIDDTTTIEESFLQDVAPIVITEDSTNLTDVHETAYVEIGDTLDLKVVVDNVILNKLVSITMIGANSNVESIPTKLKANFNETGEVTIPVTTANIGVTHLQVQYVLDENGTNTTYLGQHYTLQIMPTSLTYPFLNIIQLSDEERARLGNLTTYTVQSYLRINTEEEEVFDWMKNYRLGVFNPETIESSPTDLEIFQGVQEWSEALNEVNSFESITSEFTYHEGSPVYVVITGDYMEGNPQDNTVDFTNPCIIESDVYTGFEGTGNYPLPINNTFSTTEVSTLSVHAFEAGTPFVFSEFGLNENFGTDGDMAVTGIMIELDVDYSDELSLSAKLKAPTGETGERSIIISPTNNDDSTSISLGGVRDTWGFKIDELTNLEDWEIELQANNVFSNSTNEGRISFNNATLTIYHNAINDAVVTVKVEDADTRYYGLFLEDVEIPGGLNTETKYLEIEGTDSHDSYRQNIDRKEIKLKMSIDSCDIYDSTELLRNIIKLFTNKRDELNRPIPKKIWFSHYPDIYFEFILEDAIDNSFEEDKLDITLVIPSGTAYALEDTITNVTGSNISLAKVNPTIVFIPISDNVEIVENNSEQKFNITNPNWNSNQLVEIDCENRQVWLKTSEEDNNPTEISSYVDFNSDWFILHDEYNFSSTNCIIQTVTFTERW